jgi:hypothetical protein
MFPVSGKFEFKGKQFTDYEHPIAMLYAPYGTKNQEMYLSE